MKPTTIIAILIAIAMFSIELILNPINLNYQCLNVTYSSDLNGKHTYTWCSDKIDNFKNYNYYILDYRFQKITNEFYKEKTGKELNPEEYYHMNVFDSVSGVMVSESNRSSFEALSELPKSE